MCPELFGPFRWGIFHALFSVWIGARAEAALPGARVHVHFPRLRGGETTMGINIHFYALSRTVIPFM